MTVSTFEHSVTRFGLYKIFFHFKAVVHPSRVRVNPRDTDSTGPIPPNLQTLARWKTEEAMKRYTHMRPEDYADFVDIASRTDAGVALPVGLPAIDPGNFVAEISGAIAEMEAPPPREGAAPRRAVSSSRASARHLLTLATMRVRGSG